MGFNTWNTFGPAISDAVIRETADAMVEKGLRDAGYEYLVIDDCWSMRERDPETDRLMPDPQKFPRGIKDLADYVHGKGLKFGIYSCDGVMTCNRYPGSFDHEYLDAETFAGWGVDFLKYDNCFKPEAANGPLLYRRMAMALRASGRDILFSACNWGADDVQNWIRSSGAHMYRSTGDINDSFVSFRDIYMSQMDKFAYSAPGCFNDVDMLTCGMYGKGNVAVTGCTDDEYRTEFVLWCMSSAPLMLGCDVRSVSDATLKLVTNRDLIRIDQDEEGRPPFISRHTSNWGDYFTMVKVLSGNELAVAFVNLDDRPLYCSLLNETIGLTASSGKKLYLRDVFTGEELPPVKSRFGRDVPPHCAFCYLGRIGD
jgi:alpha-galactosidase